MIVVEMGFLFEGSAFGFEGFGDAEGFAMGEFFDGEEEVFSLFGEASFGGFGVGTEFFDFLVESFIFLAMNWELNFIGVHCNKNMNPSVFFIH